MLLKMEGIEEDKIGSGPKDSMDVFLYHYTIFVFRYLVLM